MKRNYFIVVLIFLIFFVISFLTNIIGPLIPEIIEDFNLSLTMVAVLPFAFFIAYGVMSIPSGILLEKYSEKPMILSAFSVAFLGALLFALIPAYFTAIISLFLIGAGMAILQVVINPLLRVAGGEEHFAFNSTIAQLVFGLASFISPLVYTYLVLNLQNHSNGAEYGWFINAMAHLVPENLTWISLYWLFALISILMIGILAVIKIPRVELISGEKSGTKETYLKLLKDKYVLLFFLGIFMYVGSEQGVANWISEFLKYYHGLDPQTIGAKAISRFWGLMTAGGLLGLLLLKIMDSKHVLVLFTSAAILSLLAALFGSAGIAVIAFPLIGFFMSVMYPVILSLGLNSVSEHHGSFAGILMSGIFGGAVIPLIIGGLGDIFGLRIGMLFLLITFSYVLSVGIWANPLIKNKTISNNK
jgi:MFS transporter, FHS family, L-fucose permease